MMKCKAPATRSASAALLAPAAGMILGSVLALLTVVGCAGTDGASAAADRPAGLNFYVQAVEAYNKGDTDRAVVLLLEAVRQNPDLRMARTMLGDLYRARGDYNAAATNYERLVKLDPYQAQAHYKLGLAYQLLNRLKEAAASYLRALQLDPRDWQSNMNLGLVYLALNQLDDAVTYLERASQYSPDNALVWANLGVALDARGSAVLAEAAYKKSLELDGNQNTTLLNLGANLVAQNKGQEALTVMEQAIQRTQSPPARKRYGDALALNDRFDEAATQYDSAVAADANYWPAHTAKGFALIKQYRAGMELDERLKRQAIEEWKRSLALNPNQPRVQEALAQWDRDGRLFGR